MELDELRSKIDALDDRIASLFAARMDLMDEMASLKQGMGLPVLAPDREEAVRRRLEAAHPEYAQGLDLLYTALFDLSKTKLYCLTVQEGPMARTLKGARREDVKDGPDVRVACQGVEGAYSHIAARAVFRQAPILFFPTWEEVFRTVGAGEADYGVLPIENSTAGSVSDVYDLMAKYRAWIARGVRLRIEHSLVAAPGTKLSEVREILSHPQALSQCAGFTRAHGWKATAKPNTAMAAKEVARQRRPDLAAYASELTAKLYGLEILQRAVQDAGNNYTRFIVISRELMISPDADRVSLSLTLPHRPGSLCQLLSRFAALGMNIVKLESRPLADTNFEFLFYFDLEGSVDGLSCRQLLEYLAQSCPSFSFLGNYHQVECST